MANLDSFIATFQSGEVNPLLYGRTDSDFYLRACKTLENMYVHVEGPASKRGGTKYVAPANDEDNPVRLVPFEFSSTQAYILEFGELYIRVLANDGIVQDTTVDPSVDLVVTTPYSAADLSDLQFVQSADVIFLVHPNYAPRTLIRSVDDSGNLVFTLELYEFLDGPYLNANSDEVSTLTPSATTGTGITITASGTDFEPFVSSDVGRFIRLKGTNWGYAKITAYTSSTVVTADVIEDFDSTAGTTNWAFGSWSETTGWPSAITIFEQRLVFANTVTQPQTIWATISGDFYTFSPTDADGTVADDSGLALDIGSPKVSIINWLAGAQYLIVGTSGGLYRSSTTNDSPLTPSSAKFVYNNGVECGSIQPLQVGTTIVFAQKQRKKLFSVQYDFGYDTLQDTNVTQYAEHRFFERVKEFSLQQEPHSLIWAVMDDGSLVSGTYEPNQNVIAWNGNTIGGSFRVGDAQVESVGVISADGEDNVWMVVRRTINGTERRYIERIVEESFTADQDMLVFSDSAAIIDNPISISNVTENATDATITTSDAHGLTTGDRIKISDIVGATELNDNSYTVTVVDTTNFTIQVLPENISTYVSGGYVRAYFSTITGLDHLEGETVVILGDGAIQPDKTVLSGSITLEEDSVTVIVGLEYNAILQPRNYIGSGFPTGNIQARKVKNVDTTLLVYRTLGIKYGVDLNNLTILPFRNTDDFMGVAIPLYTGKIERVRVPSVFSYDEPFYLVSDQPLPFTIQAIHYTLDITR